MEFIFCFLGYYWNKFFDKEAHRHYKETFKAVRDFVITYGTYRYVGDFTAELDELGQYQLSKCPNHFSTKYIPLETLSKTLSLIERYKIIKAYYDNPALERMYSAVTGMQCFDRKYSNFLKQAINEENLTLWEGFMNEAKYPYEEIDDLYLEDDQEVRIGHHSLKLVSYLFCRIPDNSTKTVYRNLLLSLKADLKKSILDVANPVGAVVSTARGDVGRIYSMDLLKGCNGIVVPVRDADGTLFDGDVNELIVLDENTISSMRSLVTIGLKSDDAIYFQSISGGLKVLQTIVNKFDEITAQ